MTIVLTKTAYIFLILNFLFIAFTNRTSYLMPRSFHIKMRRTVSIRNLPHLIYFFNFEKN